jgi:drug/metabolite transporter (DMT)-like permease
LERKFTGLAELFIVSLIWAFSFGIIKGVLTGVDASFVACARLGIAALALLPFLRLGRIPRKQQLQLAGIGAVQFGAMYIAYNYSFHYLQAYEVALFTIFTPIFVTLIDQVFSRKVEVVALFAAVLAVIGTGIVSWADLGSQSLAIGFLIVQVSNICFAFGQIYYRRVAATLDGVKDVQMISLLYLGGFAITAVATLALGGFRSLSTLTSTQALTLVYLGAVASGLGFFLWNRGARRVNAGALAVFNDLKVPLAVAVSLLFFGEKTDPLHLLVGGGIVLIALVLNETLPARLKLTAEKLKN